MMKKVAESADPLTQQKLCPSFKRSCVLCVRVPTEPPSSPVVGLTQFGREAAMPVRCVSRAAAAMLNSVAIGRRSRLGIGLLPLALSPNFVEMVVGDVMEPRGS